MNRINLSGIHEIDFTFPGTTIASITGPGVVSLINSYSGAGIGGVNEQTGTNYTIQASDLNKLVTINNPSAVSVTLPSAATSGFGSPFAFWIQNTGTGTVTITPTTSTIDGGATLALSQNQGAMIFSDGTNYFTERGTGTGGAGGGITALTGDVIASGSGSVPARVKSTSLTSPLPVAQGGTGTAIPSLLAGNNITVTGTWPNQTIAALAGGEGTFPGTLPTQSGLGLITSFNAGSGFTVTDTAYGVYLADTAGGGSVRGAVRAYPSGPY